jgi:hypothetical protein
MKAACWLVALLLAAFACGKSTRDPDDVDGEASGGIAGDSGGRPPLAAGGRAGNQNASGSSVSAGQGGAHAAGAASGGEGGQPTGGVAGIGGASVTVGDGLVSVTYTPAADDTVVTVTIDPDCLIFAADMNPEDLICAEITLASGSIEGRPRVCFKGDAGEKGVVRCVERTALCDGLDVVHRATEVVHCCSRQDIDASNPARTCVADVWFGRFAFGYGIDTDGDVIPNLSDNCRTVTNPIQSDQDGDRVGDSCDNCPSIPNQDQTDSNHDGIGDACSADGGAGGAGGDGGSSNAGAGGKP